MARAPRQQSESGFHHIVARGNNQQKVFHESYDFLTYRGLLEQYMALHGVQIHHYCLMTNHVHMLLSVNEIKSLGRFMHDVQRGYVVFRRKRDSITGHLWQGRYRNFPIEKEDYLLECARYIERNPVRAGLVRIPGEYPWSSYLHYAEGKRDSLIVPTPVYVSFGNTATQRQEAYRAYVGTRRNGE